MRILGFVLTAATLHVALFAVSYERTGPDVNEHLVGVALVERQWDPLAVDSNQAQSSDGMSGSDKHTPASNEHTEDLTDAPTPVKKSIPQPVDNMQQDSSVVSTPIAVDKDMAATDIPDIRQIPDQYETKTRIPTVTPAKSSAPSRVELEKESIPVAQQQQTAPTADKGALASSSDAVEVSTGSVINETQMPVREQARPRYGHNPAPAYPNIARRRGWEGTAEFNVKVLATGLVDEVRLINSSGFSSLDNAARRAIMLWRFNPATDNGREVESWVVVPVRFVLDDAARRR